MSDHVCDICGRKLLRTEVKFLSAEMMHRAIKAGLNPWKTPGIDRTALDILAKAFDGGADTAYRSWRERELGDSNQRGLCLPCAKAVAGVINPASSSQNSTAAANSSTAKSGCATLLILIGVGIPVLVNVFIR